MVGVLQFKTKRHRPRRNCLVVSAVDSSGLGVYSNRVGAGRPSIGKKTTPGCMLFNIVGQWAVTTSVDYSLSQLIQVIILLSTGGKNGGGYEASKYVIIALHAGILLLHAALSIESACFSIPHNAIIKNIWKHAISFGTEHAFEEGGVLYDKKVYIFAQIEFCETHVEGQKRVTLVPSVVVVPRNFFESERLAHHSYIQIVAFLGLALWKNNHAIKRQAMAPKKPNSGLFVGLKKVHVVTQKELAPRPTLKIADFGVAQIEAQNPRDMTGNTGTLGYMAPELIYGLLVVGCIFAEMMVEKYVPIGRIADTAVMSKIMSMFGKLNEKDRPGVAAALKLYGMEEQVISSLLP
ncbi:60S ribosomal protein l36 [Phtheirospermum japonicum]|uniref:60S ribosomal protein l36 n=1 Tax=Phtheirospermum japonicum TaxID=374723 RepID=A0A830D1W9_9LAMI|nr:60S ribosomal protein l36 [Phtheirospermum japonicum]